MFVINDFGRRRNVPCGDCDERGHCTMNCSTGETVSVDLQLADIAEERRQAQDQLDAVMKRLDASERELLGLVPDGASE